MSESRALRALEKENDKLRADFARTRTALEAKHKQVTKLVAENEEYARRLLSHMKGEGVKAICDVHGDWWHVDDEPIVCPSCRPEQALKGGGSVLKGER